MDSNGWSDTGQQFTVTRDGLILEGRHGSIAAIEAGHGIDGAECEGYNMESIGTEHEGEYDTAHMPSAMGGQRQAPCLDERPAPP